MYTVRISVGPQPNFSAGGIVELRSDVNNPPTTVRAQLALTSQAFVSTDGELTYVVPAGDFVEIRTVVFTGVPVFALIVVTEIPIG
jgi:hypothetical protein